MAEKNDLILPVGDGDWPFSHSVQPHRLSRKKPLAFDLSPDATQMTAIAAFLKIESVANLRLKGKLIPVGREDWRAEGRLTAIATQRCVVTLTPVDQRISEEVKRVYVPLSEIEDDDVIDLDQDGDDEPDGYADRIDLGHLLVESLALSLEPYPRAEGAELAQARFAPPGIAPIEDDDLKPFAKLAGLRQKLAEKE